MIRVTGFETEMGRFFFIPKGKTYGSYEFLSFQKEPKGSNGTIIRVYSDEKYIDYFVPAGYKLFIGHTDNWKVAWWRGLFPKKRDADMAKLAMGYYCDCLVFRVSTDDFIDSLLADTKAYFLRQQKRSGFEGVYFLTGDAYDVIKQSMSSIRFKNYLRDELGIDNCLKIIRSSGNEYLNIQKSTYYLKK